MLFNPILQTYLRSSLTLGGVQQSHHEAVNSQIQQQVLDHLQQIVGDLQGRQSLMTGPGGDREEVIHQYDMHDVHVAKNLCDNLTMWMI